MQLYNEAKFDRDWSIIRLVFTESVNREGKNQLRHLLCSEPLGSHKLDLIIRFLSTMLEYLHASVRHTSYDILTESLVQILPFSYYSWFDHSNITKLPSICIDATTKYTPYILNGI